jgi:hypothetical protein
MSRGALRFTSLEEMCNSTDLQNVTVLPGMIDMGLIVDQMGLCRPRASLCE